MVADRVVSANAECLSQRAANYRSAAEISLRDVRREKVYYANFYMSFIMLYQSQTLIGANLTKRNKRRVYNEEQEERIKVNNKEKEKERNPEILAVNYRQSIIQSLV